MLVFQRNLMALEILFRTQNTKKMNTPESKERKFKEKVREIGGVVLIFI